MPAFFHLLKRFRKDESGVFAVFFALMAVVLIAMSGAVVDFTSMQTARSRMQTVLDSAALALQARIKTETADALKVRAQTLVNQSITDPSMSATVDTLTTDTNAGKLNIQATLMVPTAFVQLVGIRTLTTHLTSEVTQSSSDLEVSVALDTTGSMGQPGTKIQALRDSTTNLINDLVNTVQTPTYSKMALVPYSAAVNVGTYADNIRGTVTTLNSSFASSNWMVASSSSTINKVTLTKNNPVKITTSSNNTYATGDTVYIGALSGGSTYDPYENQAYVVTKIDNKNFTLNGTSAGSTTNGSSGTAYECTYANCNVKLTGSGLATSLVTGDGVYISGASGGMSGSLNGTGWFITKIDGNNVMLNNSLALGGDTGSSASGTATRANYGDAWYHFTAADGSENTFAATTCVTERTTHSYDDTAPSTTKLSYNYASGSSPCLSAKIQPLTSNISTLTSLVSTLTAAGSTSGHLGLAWAWYMVAPNFSYLWPSASQPAAYKRANLIKAVILMTDGFFNTAYCKGIVSQDSTNGGDNEHNNCNSIDDSQSQAQAICTSIKAATTGIILYTVGFDIGSSSTDDVNARAFLSGCATDSNHFYEADTAADLDTAFSQIAQTLSALRISK